MPLWAQTGHENPAHLIELPAQEVVHPGDIIATPVVAATKLKNSRRVETRGGPGVPLEVVEFTVTPPFPSEWAAGAA